MARKKGKHKKTPKQIAASKRNLAKARAMKKGMSSHSARAHAAHARSRAKKGVAFARKLAADIASGKVKLYGD